MEFMPTTVCRHVGKMKSLKKVIPPILTKLIMYQLFRSLAYIHSQNICHRDVKPENILLDPETGVLKLGDLGSAKQLVKGEHNVSYICSRYCRPPGLNFILNTFSQLPTLDKPVNLLIRYKGLPASFMKI